MSAYALVFLLLIFKSVLLQCTYDHLLSAKISTKSMFKYFVAVTGPWAFLGLVS